MGQVGPMGVGGGAYGISNGQNTNQASSYGVPVFYPTNGLGPGGMASNILPRAPLPMYSMDAGAAVYSKQVNCSLIVLFHFVCHLC